MWKEDAEGEGERNFSSLAFFDALQTSRPFLSPHATPTGLSPIRATTYREGRAPIYKMSCLCDRPGEAESKGAGLNRVDIREVASGREGDVRAR